jgi:hypothetical protein
MSESAKRRRFEARRQRLQELIQARCGGRQADFARDTGIAPSSVSRMLYPEGKSGRKNIGEDTIAKIREVFADIAPGWFDSLPGAPGVKDKSRLHVIETDGLAPDVVKLARRIVSLEQHWRAAAECIVALGESAAKEAAKAPRRKRR